MKKITFDIDEIYCDSFFMQIRDKTGSLKILIEAIEYISMYSFINVKNPIGKIIIFIDDMSRIFFIKKDKFFSLSFPFKITDLNGEYEFFINGNNCNLGTWANIKTIISSDKYNNGSGLDFIEDIDAIEENVDKEFWSIFKSLLMYEDSYIRYDYDPSSYKKHLKLGTPDLHPLNHYDVFYSNKGTFKLGLKNKITEDDFIDVLNSKTNCKYL